MVSSPSSSTNKGGGSRAPSQCPLKAGADELAAGLSAKMGDLLLMDK
jgi:hypothetical protein